MEIRYRTHRGYLVTAEYRSDEYELKNGERWVTTSEEHSKDGAKHHFVINENGIITKGFGGKFNGIKPSEIGQEQGEAYYRKVGHKAFDEYKNIINSVIKCNADKRAKLDEAIKQAKAEYDRQDEELTKKLDKEYPIEDDVVMEELRKKYPEDSDEIWKALSDTINERIKKRDYIEWTQLKGARDKFSQLTIERANLRGQQENDIVSQISQWIAKQRGEETFSDTKAMDKHIGKSNAAKWLKVSYQMYPKSWIEQSIARGKMKVSWATKRGSYNPTLEELKLDQAHSSVASVAFHELGHRFEDIVPQLRPMAQEFLKRRIGNEKPQWLGKGYKKDEIACKDNFIDTYIGKIYQSGHTEILSMGFQYAFTEPEKLMQDRDYADFILGTLIKG